MATDEASQKPSPWRIIKSVLFEFNSDTVMDIIDRTGLRVDWAMSKNENYSHYTRKRAIKPRIDRAIESLSEPEYMKKVSMIAREINMRNQELGNEMSNLLKENGWHFDGNSLIPPNTEIRERFFPPNTPHDAYVEIRKILLKASNMLTIIDPYVGKDLLSLLRGVVDETNITQIRILTYNLPSDFLTEMKKFRKQYEGVTINVRKTKLFHDRFIILDDERCFHLGASIKDAGNKAFLMSELEDSSNLSVFLESLKNTWDNGEDI